MQLLRSRRESTLPLVTEQLRATQSKRRLGCLAHIWGEDGAPVLLRLGGTERHAIELANAMDVASECIAVDDAIDTHAVLIEVFKRIVCRPELAHVVHQLIARRRLDMRMPNSIAVVR